MSRYKQETQLRIRDSLAVIADITTGGCSGYDTETLNLVLAKLIEVKKIIKDNPPCD